VKIITSSKEISSKSRSLKKAGKRIGFVPTMGYLHEGHLSLIRKAKEDNDIVITSIFVNPMQFGPKEDFKKYPRDIRRDERLARIAGSDIIFYPSVKTIYPDRYSTYIEVKGLTETMCGASRPAHFKGVTTICNKLFNIVKPDIAYFGLKDYQQAAVIKKMVFDLDMNLKIKTAPIVREKSGLAISSRNKYLNQRHKKEATILYEALKDVKGLIRSGQRSPQKIKSHIKSLLIKTKDFKVDYIVIVDPVTLQDKKKIDKKILVALAVWLGNVRLIDNILISVPKK